MNEIIRPLADCPDCRGRGFIDSSPGKVTECNCVTRQTILRYLTPEYSTAQLDPNFPVTHFEKLLEQDLLFKNYPVMRFREKVKSYLIITGIEPKTRKSHLTVSAWDVVQAYMRPDYNVTIEHIRAVDLFILLLDNDPRNSSYSEYLILVIKERQRMGKRTLIWTRWQPDSEAFINLYGEPFAQWLMSGEANFRKISPAADEEAKPAVPLRA
jgi:hypothetical protein